MNPEKQKELGRGSLKKYNKNPRMDIQKVENLNKPIALINQFCKDVGIKISIAAEGARPTAPPEPPLLRRLRAMLSRRAAGRRAGRGGPARDPGDGLDPDQQVCD